MNALTIDPATQRSRLVARNYNVEALRTQTILSARPATGRGFGERFRIKHTRGEAG